MKDKHHKEGGEMANVQTENGYTRIAHQLLEETAKRKFNATQHSILLIVWRMTYGFCRKDHELAVNYFVRVTGFSKRNIQESLNSLLENKVLIETQQANFNQTRKMAFNKNYDEWLIASRTESIQVNNPSPDDEKVTSTGEQSITSTGEQSITQERKDKEIIKETVTSAFNEFWAIYKKKKNKANALKKFETQFKKYGQEKIIYGAKCYMDENKDTDTKFIKDPDTFLNQQTFLDYELEVKPDINEQKLQQDINRKRFIEKELSGGVEDFEVFGNMHVYEMYKRELREINERLRITEKED